MSTMLFECPMCRRNVEAGSDMAGQVIQCPHCQQSVRVPAQTPPPMASQVPPPVASQVPPPMGGQVPLQQKTAPAAIWSLILSILSFLCCGIFTAIPGVICGHVGLSSIRKSGGRLGGQGLCIAGLILGYIAIALTLLAIVWMIFFGGLAVLQGISQSQRY
jgi:hypothetical protein